MRSILDAVSVLSETEPHTDDALDRLSEVAKRFKPLAVPEQMEPTDDVLRFEPDEPWEVSLDSCGVDERYQRPMDRDKVKAMVKDKAYEQPIKVNFDPVDGNTSYWIVDGQHRAEAARQAGKKTIMAYVLMVPSQEEQDHETGVMAKTFDPGPFFTGGETYGATVTPSREDVVIETLEGMGAEVLVSKVAEYGYQGRTLTLRMGPRTLTYVPHDAVEKCSRDAGAVMLSQPEAGLLRFEGFSATEVVKVATLLDTELRPVEVDGSSRPDSPLAAEVFGIEGDVEILAEGIGGRTWPQEWVHVAEDLIQVHNGEEVLAYYPFISRHPTGEGDWRLIGPKQDLTIRPA